MEPLGSEYAIILNNPELVRGLIRHADRRSPKATSRTRTRLRFGIARVLRELAAQIEPRASAVEPLASRVKVWRSADVADSMTS